MKHVVTIEQKPFYLSPHFSLEEMLESETAERLGIDNSIKIPPSVGGGLRAVASRTEGGLSEKTSPASQARHPLQKGELIVANLKALCLNVLEPLREALGKPIEISSGYRCPALNRAVGGVRNSQHLTGQACDILQKRGGQKEHLKLFHLIQSLGLPFDQLIWEQGGVWIHVSYRADGKNRRQIIYS